MAEAQERLSQIEERTKEAERRAAEAERMAKLKSEEEERERGLRRSATASRKLRSARARPSAAPWKPSRQ